MSDMIRQELITALYFVLHGAEIALGCDLLRIFRRWIPHGSVMVGVEDVLFWFAVSIRTFLLIFLRLDGTLRLYTAAAIAAGFFFWTKLRSRFLTKIDHFRQKTVAKSVKKA